MAATIIERATESGSTVLVLNSSEEMLSQVDRVVVLKDGMKYLDISRDKFNWSVMKLEDQEEDNEEVAQMKRRISETKKYLEGLKAK